jgi:cytochrome c peroxidase
MTGVVRRFACCVTASFGMLISCQSATAGGQIGKNAQADAATTASTQGGGRSKQTKTVLLGSPELTSGIRGNGPLTVAEIKAWLAQPGVHEVLNVELPLGLNAGRPKGLEANPLTRAKIELGRQLYFDPRLSADATISCASCHAPEEGWVKHSQFGIGIRGQVGGRNSPPSFNRILSDAQFWDGRAASLEAQAIGPIANPIEMGNTHPQAVLAIGAVEGYRLEFAAVFGKSGVTIDNAAKAIASFERAVVTGPSPFDYYEALRPFAKMSKDDLDEMKQDDKPTYAKYEKLLALSKEHPMSANAIRGRDLFFSERVNCSACHVGANLTDEKYHNLGVGMDKPQPDLGRFAETKNEADKGAFKTPTIRNVAQSAPYMHDGSQRTLEEVIAWYNKGGHPNAHLDAKVKPLKLTSEEQAALVEFLKACTGDFPPVNSSRLPASETAKSPRTEIRRPGTR